MDASVDPHYTGQFRMVLTVNAGFDIFEAVAVGLAAPVLDVLHVRRFRGRLDHPELILRREFIGYFPAAPHVEELYAVYLKERAGEEIQ
jgi:hypothetical protein